MMTLPIRPWKLILLMLVSFAEGVSGLDSTAALTITGVVVGAFFLMLITACCAIFLWRGRNGKGEQLMRNREGIMAQYNGGYLIGSQHPASINNMQKPSGPIYWVRAMPPAVSTVKRGPRYMWRTQEELQSQRQVLSEEKQTKHAPVQQKRRRHKRQRDATSTHITSHVGPKYKTKISYRTDDSGLPEIYSSQESQYTSNELDVLYMERTSTEEEQGKTVVDARPSIGSKSDVGSQTDGIGDHEKRGSRKSSMPLTNGSIQMGGFYARRAADFTSTSNDIVSSNISARSLRSSLTTVSTLPSNESGFNSLTDQHRITLANENNKVYRILSSDMNKKGRLGPVESINSSHQEDHESNTTIDPQSEVGGVNSSHNDSFSVTESRQNSVKSTGNTSAFQITRM